MSEIKQASFRLNDEDINTFREMTEKHDMNQAEMFQSLIHAFEMNKAKNQLADRGKEIDTFQTTVNTLVNMFLNSLEINQTSEERIRQVLSLELNTKDKTIKDLQDKREQLENEKDNFKKAALENIKTVKELQAENDNIKNELSDKSATINSLQSQLQTMNGIIDEYKGYKETNSELEKEIKELNKTISELEASNKNITMQLTNEINMKEFYEREVNELKGSIERINAENKTLEQQHKQYITSLEQEHRQELEQINNNHKEELSDVEIKHQDIIDKELSNLKKNFEDKLQLEKEKLDFVKAKNEAELENIKSKYNDLKEKHDAIINENYRSVIKVPKATKKKNDAPEDKVASKEGKES